MINLKGYVLEEKLSETSMTTVYKGKKEYEDTPLAFKILKGPHPTYEQSTRIEQEYLRLKELSLEGLIKPVSLKKTPEGPVLIMEYFPGQPLSKEIKTALPDLKAFFSLALRITATLGEIHKKNIIHKDITLANILWDRVQDKIKIIDFGISTPFARETNEALHPNNLEGTLFYISPEQTGRMNRSIDYRTDYYSLGVCFYKLLTGEYPLNSRDHVQLVHFHLAKEPEAPHTLNPRIPPALSAIVMKLLAKRAEERYQSTEGLQADLEKCRDLMEKGEIPDFSPGRKDRSRQFTVPEKLYGREKEKKILLEGFRRAASGRKEVLYFSGPPGIGKSALINEIQKPIVEKRGYFLSGKFDQFSQGIPYSAFLRAFEHLCRQLLTETDEDLDKWKKQILQAVGINGRVLTEVIPEGELIIGKQPEVPPLPPTESRNRFNLTLIEFFKVFTTRSHPVVLFLDDLQWADPASLQLLNLLISGQELNAFLFIGAYRDNEVPPDHPFAQLQEETRKKEVSWQNFTLHPLRQEDIILLCSEAMQRKDTKELSRLVLSKTGGNPFFVREFLQTLSMKGLIFPDNNYGWNWNLQGIEEAGITDNVVSLMAGRIKKLSSPAWEGMKIAACLGNRITKELYASITGCPESTAFDKIGENINKGMLIKTGDELKFAHDRVQEAAYSLIPREEQIKLHHKIGMNLLDHADEKTLEDMIFVITGQLNKAADILNPREKLRLIDLNLQGAVKAKSSAAYSAAAGLMEKSSRLLPANKWNEDYSRTFAVYIHWAEAAVLAGDFPRANKLFIILREKTEELFDKVQVFALQITAFTLQKELQKAMDTACEALALLGVILPAATTPGTAGAAIKDEARKLDAIVNSRLREELFEIPELSNKKQMAVADILFLALGTAMQSSYPLSPIIIMKLTRFTLEHGYSKGSPFGLLMYGFVLSSLQGDYEGDKLFNDLASHFITKIKDKVAQTTAIAVQSWTYYFLIDHYKKILSILRNVAPHCREAGNFEFLGYAYYYTAHVHLFGGSDSLDATREELEKIAPLLHKLGQPQSSALFNMAYQLVILFQENPSGKSIIRGHYFDETLLNPEEITPESAVELMFLYILKFIPLCIYREWEKAPAYAELVDALITTQPVFAGSINGTVYDFYLALALINLSGETTEKGNESEYLKRAESIVAKYEKLAYYNPFMHKHRYHLLKAEQYRIAGEQMEKVIEQYNEGIRIAVQNSITQDEALGNELAAHYMIQKKIPLFAATYMTKAFYAYQKWGAKPKAEIIMNTYPALVTLDSKSAHSGSIMTTNLSTSSAEKLDLLTIIKASRAISREIKQEGLLKQIMQIVLENAGAEKGFFLTPLEDRWVIKASGTMPLENIKVSLALPAEDSVHLSPGIVHYVARTGKSIVLDDASNQGEFINDPYIKHNGTRSLLCIPLIYHGKISSILYLENNFSPRVFSEERFATIKTLSSQMIISMENARMFGELENLNKTLEQKVIERTKELAQKNEVIDKHNKDLMDNLKMAESIQNSILPSAKELTDLFEEHFVLFKPQEIVSGDFYWVKKMKDGTILIAIVDCTGHGVRGSLVTMSTHSTLESIVSHYTFSSPAEILKALNKNIRKILKQNQDNAATNDGLDMSLLYYEPGKKQLRYAGALQDLFYVREGETYMVQGDRQSIGYADSNEDFIYTNKEIPLAGTSAIYMMSDGFVNQLGGLRNFPFGKKRFIKLIQDYEKIPLKDQGEHLWTIFEEYRQGQFPALDDVTVMGFKMKG